MSRLDFEEFLQEAEASLNRSLDPKWRNVSLVDLGFDSLDHFVLRIMSEDLASFDPVHQNEDAAMIDTLDDAYALYLRLEAASE